jgi:hypothetical protein
MSEDNSFTESEKSEEQKMTFRDLLKKLTIKNHDTGMTEINMNIRDEVLQQHEMEEILERDSANEVSSCNSSALKTNQSLIGGEFLNDIPGINRSLDNPEEPLNFRSSSSLHRPTQTLHTAQNFIISNTINS